jgi:hypothetical protein
MSSNQDRTSPKQPGPHLFSSRCLATLKRATATYDERGDQYGDTWRNARFLALKAVLHKFGILVSPRFLRMIAAAVLVDTKYQRLEGGYKDDSIVDGINYQAFLAEEVRELERELANEEPCGGDK